MPLEEYHKAMRQGLKEEKEAIARGEEPGLRVLPENPDTLAVRRESLGVVEIPSELIDGTCNDLRKNAFSRGFYPVLQEESEFAHKWSNLCKAHLEEGIRDPIKAVEYLNHFYVVEGHKRVSVLKYFGAISIPGVVTRLLPKPSDDPEVVAYYEFLDFYQMTGLNFVVFKRPGEYRELLQALGRTNREAWSAEEIYAFRSFYYMFRDACYRDNADRRYISVALLVYLKIFGYQQSRNKLSSEIGKELVKIRPEILNRLENAGATLVLEDAVKKPLFSFSTTGKICAAFIHGGSAATSKWVYNHEYGRYLLDNTMGDQVRTLSYENVLTDEQADEAIENAVKKGADMIFTTTPKLLLPSVKAAVLHPDVKILNCSLNTAYPSVRTYYPRLYDAKFIKGAIAGTLVQDGRIGYVADYPTYGSIAGINAFAQGARMVNANARVYLEWANLKEGGGVERLHEKGIVYIDHLDRLAANTGNDVHGMHNLALIQCHWGRLYRSLVRRVVEGSWKQEERGSSAISYWWGMTQGIVGVLCSRRLPIGTRRLASVLRDAIREDRLDPFYGVLMDQQGRVIYGDDAPLPADQILSMNWLSAYVEGRIPAFDELTPKAQELVKLQGIQGLEGSVDP